MDWEMLCRVCLQNGDLVSLFDSDENDELLSDKFTYCSNVEITTTDLLPSQICLSCVDRLLTAYQFKQQCVSSNNTLKECLAEFKEVTQGNTEAQGELDKNELITVKQENGTYVQYEVPVESSPQWGRPKTPVKRGRGRPRKYPNELGEITVSPYQKKKDSLNDMVIKEEPLEDDEDIDYSMEAEDPDYEPESDETLQFITEDGTTVKVKSNKKSRSRTKKSREVSLEAEEADDVLLMEETLLAETKQPDPMLTEPKPRKKYAKKKYQYEKTHTCEVCGSSFRSNASLQAHIRRHLGIKPFSCTICGYSCVLNMELRRHMMRHTGARPYQCRICERRFGDFGSRQKHERLHLGQRPYMCSLCGKNFTYSYVLANHMLTHTGEKKYSCELCNKKFTKSHHLKYHNKVHHKALYIQQQMELDAKKMQHTNINIGEFGQHFLGSNVQLSGQDVQTLISESGAADIKQEAYTLAQVEEMDENEEQYESEHNQQYQHQDESGFKLQIDRNQSEDGQDQEIQQHQILLGTDIRIQHYTDEGGETTIVCEIPENIAEQFQGQIQGQIQEIHEQEQQSTKIEEIQDAQDGDSIEEDTEHLLQIQQDEDTS